MLGGAREMLQISLMLTNSFLQRLVLSAVIGMVLAGGVQFYRHIIKAGDDALNGKYRKDAPFVDPNIPINSGGAAPRRK
jgi:hypothetical protein